MTNAATPEPEPPGRAFAHWGMISGRLPGLGQARQELAAILV